MCILSVKMLTHNSLFQHIRPRRIFTLPGLATCCLATCDRTRLYYILIKILVMIHRIRLFLSYTQQSIKMHSTDRYEIFKINYRYFCTLVISNFGINLSPIITFKNKRLPQFKWIQHMIFMLHTSGWNKFLMILQIMDRNIMGIKRGFLLKGCTFPQDL